MSITVKPISIKDIIETPFHHLRYGDTPWIVMTGKSVDDTEAPEVDFSGANLHIPGQKEDMLATVQRPHKDIMYGITPYSIERFEKYIVRLAKDIEWWHGDIWKDIYTSKSGDADIFIHWLKGRETCLVGPPHMERLGEAIGFYPKIRYVTYRDSYRQCKEAAVYLAERKDEYDVVLFSAGPLTQIVLHGMCDILKGKKMIDTGAFFDPYCGELSRAFHGKKWKKAVLPINPNYRDKY